MTSDETPTQEDGALEETETVETATGDTEVVEPVQTSTSAQRSFSENFQKFLNESDIHIGNAKGIESGRPNLGFNEFVYTGKNVVSKRLPDFVYNIHKQIFASDVVRGESKVDVTSDLNFGQYGNPVIDIPVGYTGIIYFLIGFDVFNNSIVKSCHQKCEVHTRINTPGDGALFAFKFNNGTLVADGWVNRGPKQETDTNYKLFLHTGTFELLGKTFVSGFFVHADGKPRHTYVKTYSTRGNHGNTVLTFFMNAWKKKTCKRNVCHNTCTCTANATFEIKIQEPWEGDEGWNEGWIKMVTNDYAPYDSGSYNSWNSFQGLYASWYNEKVPDTEGKVGSGSIDWWMNKYDYGYKDVPLKAQMGWLSTDIGYIYDINGNPVGV